MMLKLERQEMWSESTNYRTRRLSFINPLIPFLHPFLFNGFQEHSEIPGNELGNQAAKEATSIVTHTILPVSFSSSLQVINNKIRDNPPIHSQVAQIYQHQRGSGDSKQIKNQQDNVLLARLWSAHHPSLNQYLHHLDPAIHPICL